MSSLVILPAARALSVRALANGLQKIQSLKAPTPAAASSFTSTGPPRTYILLLDPAEPTRTNGPTDRRTTVTKNTLHMASTVYAAAAAAKQADVYLLVGHLVLATSASTKDIYKNLNADLRHVFCDARVWGARGGGGDGESDAEISVPEGALRSIREKLESYGITRGKHIEVQGVAMAEEAESSAGKGGELSKTSSTAATADPAPPSRVPGNTANSIRSTPHNRNGDASASADGSASSGSTTTNGGDATPLQRYPAVVLGGTFDGLHSAHKILLTESAMMATKRVLVGLASDTLLKSKKLRELIASGDDRLEELVRFYGEIFGTPGGAAPARMEGTETDPAGATNRKVTLVFNPGRREGDAGRQEANAGQREAHGNGGQQEEETAFRIEIPLITDPAGPSGYDPDFTCISVSAETIKGADFCNNERRKKGLGEMFVHVINGGELLGDAEANGEMGEESKVSSSSSRLRKLGRLLRNPENAIVNAGSLSKALALASASSSSSSGSGQRLGQDSSSQQQQQPLELLKANLGQKELFLSELGSDGETPATRSCYVLGLTGGSGSGKSTVCRFLLEEYAGEVFVVDCDKIGQAAYAVPGNACWTDLVEHFGKDSDGEEDRSRILTDDGSEMIDRRKLGGIVFADKKELEKLNRLVWPHIEKEAWAQVGKAVEEFREARKAGAEDTGKLPIPVVVLDAAVLLEARWSCDEVWVCFVPKEEQIKRIIERDNLEEARAVARISSQMTNEERVKQAHVLLTTLYETSVTHTIVKKAIDLLKDRVRAGLGASSKIVGGGGDGNGPGGVDGGGAGGGEEQLVSL